jgi:hypothetical protein
MGGGDGGDALHWMREHRLTYCGIGSHYRSCSPVPGHCTTNPHPAPVPATSKMRVSFSREINEENPRKRVTKSSSDMRSKTGKSLDLDSNHRPPDRPWNSSPRTRELSPPAPPAPTEPDDNDLQDQIQARYHHLLRQMKGGEGRGTVEKGHNHRSLPPPPPAPSAPNHPPSIGLPRNEPLSAAAALSLPQQQEQSGILDLTIPEPYSSTTLRPEAQPQYPTINTYTPTPQNHPSKPKTLPVHSARRGKDLRNRSLSPSRSVSPRRGRATGAGAGAGVGGRSISPTITGVKLRKSSSPIRAVRGTSRTPQRAPVGTAGSPIRAKTATGPLSQGVRTGRSRSRSPMGVRTVRTARSIAGVNAGGDADIEAGREIERGRSRGEVMMTRTLMGDNSKVLMNVDRDNRISSAQEGARRSGSRSERSISPRRRGILDRGISGPRSQSRGNIRSLSPARNVRSARTVGLQGTALTAAMRAVTPMARRYAFTPSSGVDAEAAVDTGVDSAVDSTFDTEVDRAVQGVGAVKENMDLSEELLIGVEVNTPIPSSKPSPVSHSGSVFSLRGQTPMSSSASMSASSVATATSVSPDSQTSSIRSNGNTREMEGDSVRSGESGRETERVRETERERGNGSQSGSVKSSGSGRDRNDDQSRQSASSSPSPSLSSRDAVRVPMSRSVSVSAAASVSASSLGASPDSYASSSRNKSDAMEKERERDRVRSVESGRVVEREIERERGSGSVKSSGRDSGRDLNRDADRNQQTSSPSPSLSSRDPVRVPMSRSASVSAAASVSASSLGAVSSAAASVSKDSLSRSKSDTMEREGARERERGSEESQGGSVKSSNSGKDRIRDSSRDRNDDQSHQSASSSPSPSLSSRDAVRVPMSRSVSVSAAASVSASSLGASPDSYASSSRNKSDAMEKERERERESDRDSVREMQSARESVREIEREIERASQGGSVKSSNSGRDRIRDSDSGRDRIRDSDSSRDNDRGRDRGGDRNDHRSRQSASSSPSPSLSSRDPVRVPMSRSVSVSAAASVSDVPAQTVIRDAQTVEEHRDDSPHALNAMASDASPTAYATPLTAGSPDSNGDSNSDGDADTFDTSSMRSRISAADRHLAIQLESTSPSRSPNLRRLLTPKVQDPIQDPPHSPSVSRDETVEDGFPVAVDLAGMLQRAREGLEGVDVWIEEENGKWDIIADIEGIEGRQDIMFSPFGFALHNKEEMESILGPLPSQTIKNRTAERNSLVALDKLSMKAMQGQVDAALQDLALMRRNEVLSWEANDILRNTAKSARRATAAVADKAVNRLKKCTERVRVLRGDTEAATKWHSFLQVILGEIEVL